MPKADVNYRNGGKPARPESELSPKSAMKAEKYRKLERLGEGSFGTAYLVEKADEVGQKRFVLKEIRCRDKEQVIDALREMVTMRILQCPWVVRYEDYWTEDLNVILVMEYCPGGDLYREMNKALKKKTHLPEETVMKWFTQIALGLNEIHNRSFMHRDIKPSNVFLDSQGNAKLGDFGLTNNIGGADINESYRGTICGTPGFLSPEIERGDKYNVKSDVWALAGTLYEMLALRSVFQDTLDGTFPGPIPDMYSQEVCDLLRSMLVPEMALRPHVRDILKIPIVARYVRKELGLPDQDDQQQTVTDTSGDVQTSSEADSPLNLSDVLVKLRNLQFDAFLLDLKSHPVATFYLAVTAFMILKIIRLI